MCFTATAAAVEEPTDDQDDIGRDEAPHAKQATPFEYWR
jgi:hypothetical protein